MKSNLTAKDIEDFFIRVYFNTELGFINAAIKRAYLDFCRTLEALPKNDEQKTKFIDNLVCILHERITELLESKFENQEEFDFWHQKTCFKLTTNQDDDFSPTGLTNGHAQKWINMSLKYLYSFGEDRIINISNNYRFFHIPIDNIIQKKLQIQFGIPKFSVAWSKIKGYDEYIHYQKEFRVAVYGQIPMDVEFKLFNEV